MTENRNEEVKEIKEVKEVKSKIEKKDILFKNITDLTKKEIDLLPKISIVLRKVENRRTRNVFYEIIIRFNDLLKINYSSRDLKNKFSETKYNLYCLKLNLDLNKAEHPLRVPCRLVTGKREDDSDYYQLELILSDDIYITDIWLSQDEYELLILTLPKIKFEIRPEKIANINLDFEQ